MGAFTSLLGMGLTAYGMFQSGQDARAAAEYNSAIYRQKAQIIDQKKKLTEKSYDRMIRKLEGSTIAAVAGSGFDLSGSMLEVLNDNLTQAELDREIELYNLEVEKRQAISSSSEASRQGRIAQRSATIGAVSTLLTEGNEWYMKYGGFGKTTSSPKPRASLNNVPALYQPSLTY